MKGSAITGPVGKEAAELWPVSADFFPFLGNKFAKREYSVSLPTLASLCKRDTFFSTGRNTEKN